MNDATALKRLKADPRVESVWDEGEDGWWCDLKPNWFSDSTETGRLHEGTPQDLWEVLNGGDTRLRRPESEGGEPSDGGVFDPSLPPYTMNTKTITLTPYQAELLDDRPEECVHECVAETHGDSTCLPETIEHVKACIRSRRIDLVEFTPVMEAILLDCLQGSTVCGQLFPFGGVFDTPRERLAYANAVKSVRTLAEKFRAAGLAVTYVPDA